MNFPRLLIADERREDIIPSGVVLATTLKLIGVKVKLFAGGIDERYLRLLSLSCEQEVYSIDPCQMRSDSDIRSFFGSLAISDGINLILSPVGSMVSEDRMEINRNTMDLARILQCGVVALIHSNPIAAITSKVMETIYQSFLSDKIDLYGVVFASVLNPREYQLLEIELGRRVPVMSLGYIPRYMERKIIPLMDLCSDPRAVQPARNLAAQLKSMLGQIEWNALISFSSYSSFLDIPESKFESLAGGPLVSVLSDSSLSVGVDNDIAFFKTLGCRLCMVDLKKDIIPSSTTMVYIPHGLGSLAMEQLSQNPELRTQVKSLPLRSSLSFVNGGFSAVCGKSYSLFDTEDSYPGLEILECVFNYGRFRGFGVPADIEPLESGQSLLPFNDREKASGYIPAYMKDNINLPDKGQCSWLIRHADNREVLGEGGWKLKKMLGSQVKIELWSCPELFKRWIRQETR